MRQLLRRVWYALRHRQRDTELAEEIEFHRTLRQRALEREGLGSDRAALAARRALGSTALARDQARDIWIWPWLQDVSQDVRIAVRLLVRDWRFALAAVAALALAIGANNTAFTVMNTMLLRDLPFQQPDRLVSLGSRDPHSRPIIPAYPDFQDWRDAARSFTGLVGEIGTAMNLSGEVRAPERVAGSYISADAFRLLGRSPLLGRDFLPEDDRPGAALVVMLSHNVWTNRYARDPATIGQTVRVNDVPATIIGVMPERFAFPFASDVWLPLTQFTGVTTATRGGRPRSATPVVYGRLGDGTTLAQARAEMATIAERLARDYPATNAGITVTVAPLQDSYVGNIRPIVTALMGAVAFVLLIACVNVANLLLARSTYRSREIAIRASLGATRWRIVRQLLIESTLMAALAGALGLLCSLAGVRAISAVMAPADQPPPFWIDWSMDAGVYAFLAVVCLATSILCGLVPALHVSRTPVNSVLKDGNRGVAGSVHAFRWTNALMVTELALTLILLAGAGLMLRSFLAVSRASQSIDTTNVITARLAVANQKYPTAGARHRFFGQLEERLQSVPGIASATVASDVPLGATSVPALIHRQISVEGREVIPGEAPRTVARVYVGSRYFETLGVRPLRGRDFLDGHSAPGQEGAIVNARFAAMFFGDGNPIGQRIRLSSGNPGGSAAPAWTIVGVVPTVPQAANASVPDPVVYIPVRTEPEPSRFATLIVRGVGDAAALVPALREAVRSVDVDLPLYFVMTMDQIREVSLWGHRVWGALFGLLAGIALTLSAVGLYALTAQSVVQRTQEIGIRMALGAQVSQVVSLFAWKTVVPLALGVLTGLGGALAAGSLLQTLLVGTSARDPLTLAVVTGLLVLVALIGTILPARRAAHVDPTVALRYE